MSISSRFLLFTTSFILLFTAQNHSAEGEPNGDRLISYVNPFIGTGNASETGGMMAHFASGSVHPGALAPWGMATFAPRNQMVLNDIYCGSEVLTETPNGYKYGSPFIFGFSHTLLSGSGCPALGNVIVMPTTGVVNPDFKNNKSHFTDEKASPGYYSVELLTPQVTVEACATTRSILSLFTFQEQTDSANVVIDLYHSLIAASDATIRIISDTEVEGWCLGACFCNRPIQYTVHFVVKFNRAFHTYGTYDSTHVYSEKNNQSGKFSGAFVRFDADPGNPVMMKTGISYVSIDNARLNMETELPNWDFKKILGNTKNRWEEELSKIKVEGGAEGQKEIFYTALYHSLIHPNIFNDVNGEYVTMDTQQIQRLEPDRKAQYTVFSLWDTYRNLHPLLTLIYPERQLEMVKSMVSHYQSGGFLPKWEIVANESYVMVGDPACPVIADTYIKGIRDFDVKSAYEAMKKSATLCENNDIRPGNKAYREYGFIPFDHPEASDCWGVASTTLEYAYADWCIAQLAFELGEEGDYQEYLSKSRSWKNLYDSESGFLLPRNRDRSIIEQFDEDTLKGSQPGDWESGGPGYVEGNAWQYNFFVPHGIKELAVLMGEESFVKRLQSCFDVQGRFMLFNEPDMAYPYLFNYIEGEAWRSQKEIRKTIYKYFNTSAGGLPGNDDCGTLSAWLIFSMMGFYPACPGTQEYQLGSPVFDKVTIQLNSDFYDGDQFIIETENNSKENYYIRKGELNGKILNQPFLEHTDMINGGRLFLRMGDMPGLQE